MNPKFKELAFDVVLPSHLLVNPNLEPNAKLFYGLVRNLTKMEGYCFASNSYLAELMEVTPRTIQLWLESLEEQGYIERINEDGFNSQRKIFISDNFKKSLQCEKSFTPPRKEFHPPMKKVSPNKEDILKKIEEREPPPSGSSPPPQACEVADLLLEAIKKTKPDIKQPNLKSWVIEIDRMIRIDKRKIESIKKIIEWLPKSPTNKGFSWKNNILSAEAFREQFDKLELAMRQDPCQGSLNNLQLIKKLEDRKDLVSKGIIVIGADYVQFPKIVDAYYKVGENGFKEKVLSALRKSGVPIK